MHWFDSLTSTWQLPCPQQKSRTGVGLADFRQLQHLAGSSRPAAYQVHYRCPECQDQHSVMLTADQLDLDPVYSMPGSFWDLGEGRMDWPVETGSQLWANSIRRGRWPLMLHCRYQDQDFGGWPSLLRHLEPDLPQKPRQMFLTYHCPICREIDHLQVSARRLGLHPIS